MKTKNSAYLVLTVILVILSVIGGYFLFKTINGQRDPLSTSQASKIELIPTDSLDSEDLISSNSGQVIESTPIASLTSKVKITPTITPTKAIISTITPTTSSNSSTSLTYSSSSDKFSIDYSPTRKLYQDTESSGNRYTFYLSSGNFAVHIGLDNQWAWSNSDREFTDDFFVADQPTFRYDTSTQTIVDIQTEDRNYTIQCVHNGQESLKTECEKFIKSFKLI
ncbi:MAG: hypothetical protein PHX34_03775 [Candidatus Shapirobacteria bacterium]|nr:hypothetical protein [Candidatus Shapirobacteria bacterium]